MSVLMTEKEKRQLGLQPVALALVKSRGSMQQHKPSVNEHFKAAMAQAKHLPHILTPKVKHAQQKSILRSLLSGLKAGK